MKLRLLLCALALLPVLCAAAGKPAGFEAFELVRTRNIFDPNRRAVRKETEASRTQAAAAARPRSVHLTLTGTLVTDRRALAFFSGSRSEFNKIGGTGEKVGAFTIGRISGHDVELKDGDKVTLVAVGKRLQLEGTEADPVESEPAAGTGTPASADAAPASAGAPATAPAGSPSDILKRMMERRAQEMKK